MTYEAYWLALVLANAGCGVPLTAYIDPDVNGMSPPGPEHWRDAAREAVEGDDMTGVKLIARERHRQISDEGWTAEHDRRHCDGSLAIAGAWYALPPDNRDGLPWPWDKIDCKPTPGNRVKELVKAGALIAAEIDRLEQARKTVEEACASSK